MLSLRIQWISPSQKAPFYALCKKGRFRPLSGECVPFAEVLVERGMHGTGLAAMIDVFCCGIFILWNFEREEL